MVSEANVIAEVVKQLGRLLPQVEIHSLQAEACFRDVRFDFVARVQVGDVTKTLLGQVRSCGQPRFLRQTIAWFQETGIADPSVYLLIAAPYVSQRGMELCRQHQVGCVDLAGNCYLAFDSVYIERSVEDAPPRVRRALKNLLAPVSSRIIRAVLEEPHRAWKLTTLSEATGVSLGQTYNVSEKLVAQGFAEKRSREGLTLRDAAGLLDLWRDEYNIAVANEVRSFHSSERDPAQLMTEARRFAEGAGSTYAFTLHAGASLVAPYVRFNDVHLYIGSPVESWVDGLGLSAVEFGGNVHLLQPYDEGVFYRARAVRDMVVVGNIQLYLDLYNYPARGREQAEFLRAREIAF